MKMNCPLCGNHEGFGTIALDGRFYLWHPCRVVGINVYWRDGFWIALKPGKSEEQIIRRIRQRSKR